MRKWTMTIILPGNVVLIEFKTEDKHILKCPVELYEQLEKSELPRICQMAE